MAGTSTEPNNNSLSEISDFFSGRGVFLTGATGYIGKVLIEKLLRSCSDVKCIYILIRSRKGQDAQERRKHLLTNKVYQVLRKMNPDFEKKVVAMSGDVSEDNLGLSEEDRDTLCREVSVVIHGAATIRFDEPIKQCLNLNVKGTMRMIALSKKMTNLAVFIHVSTAYSNCDRHYIGEEVYPPPMDPHNLLKCLEFMDDETADVITPVLIGAKRNTYVFAKSLAEYLVNEEAKTMPIAIVRPTIVLGAWKEPLPGWMDNANGPIALSIAVAKGMVRTLRADVHKVCEIIPVNFAVNILLAVSRQVTISKRPDSGAMVFNCSSANVNPCTWGDYNYWCTTANWRNPVVNPYWFPSCSVESCRAAYVAKDFIFHYIPAHILDAVHRFTGKKANMVKIYTKLSRANNAVEHFRIVEWKFGNENLLKLWDSLSKYDQNVFNFDYQTIDWPTYFNHQVMGIKKYLFNEGLEEIPSSRKRIKVYYVLDVIIQLLFYYLILSFLWNAIFEDFIIDNSASRITNVTLKNYPQLKMAAIAEK